MKKFIVFFVIIGSAMLFGHRQHTHQYITSEAYKLLKLYLGFDVPQMKDHIDASDCVGDKPWQKGYLNTGAWREDVEDVIYNYSKESTPTLTGVCGLLSDAIAVFGGISPDGFVSSTHFWYADFGDEVSSTIRASVSGCTFSFTVPNAYQKIKKYATPNRSWTIKYSPLGLSQGVSTFRLPNGNTIDITWRQHIGIQYYSLIDLFTTGRAWVVGTYASNGEWINMNYEVRLNVGSENRKNLLVWEILGRMCHLLQDMTVPAHTNNDPHGGGGLRDDSFEAHFGYDFYWTADNTFQQYGDIINPYDYSSTDPIHFLMYTSNQSANHFATNGPHYEPNNDIFNGNPTAAELAYLSAQNISAFGGPTTMEESFDSIQILNIRNHMLPIAIRATAGLLYWFAYEANLITKVRVQNNFTGGIVLINNVQTNAPYDISLRYGDSIIVGAINQTDDQGYQRVWNNYTANNRSVWQKQVGSVTTNCSGGENSSYTIHVITGENNVCYTAPLRRRYNISRSDCTEFDGTSSAGVVAQIVEGNTGQITAPATKTLNGRQYNFAGWTDGDTTNPRTISSPTANATYTAFYKYPNHTNYSYTSYFNNQRKLIRTDEAIKLYKVYESFNKVWLEVSVDDGTTWKILNNGMPLNTGNAKCASISTYGSSIAIVYQQQCDSGFKIMLRFFYPQTKDCFMGVGPYIVATEENESYSTHANPVIAWGYYGQFLITYEKKCGTQLDSAGINYYFGSSDGTNVYWNSHGHVPHTDVNSRTPAIDCLQTDQEFNPAFHLLWWKTTGPASCSVYYDKILWNDNNTLTFTTPQNVSSDLEYPGSANENLIAYMSDSPEFIWKSEIYDYEDGDVYTIYSTIVLKNSNMHWEFGDDAAWPSIVKNKDEDFYAFSWQAGNGNYQFATSDDFTINTIGNYGYAAQLCPGGSLYNMYLLGLGDDAPSMYHFTNSNSLGSYYYKAPATGSYVGRYADINIKGTTFRLGLSDILVDNKSINFVPIPKDDTIASLEKMNSVLESQPFQLSNNSTFDYSVVYKFGDTLKAKTALGDNGYLNFKVELVDAATGKVLGTYDTLTYSKNQVRKRSLKAYEVSAEGLGNRTVKLRMVINSNADIKSIEAVQKYSTTSAMAKRSKKSIAYNGSAKVTEYAISQNYPNPFNPTTMINYRIPKNGMVSIKIYNINGTEVANLVNEVKESGRYSVEFNARNLASGVYFYRIISGDFVQTKKMAILK